MMANYEYTCKVCNITTNITKPMSESTRKEYCKECGGALRRVYGCLINTRFPGSHNSEYQS